jgi:DNA-binding NarL/FixJ family response regulator
VSTPAHVRQVTPDDITASVTAALDAGADGYILSRKYSEMRLDTLAAAGAALRRRP